MLRSMPRTARWDTDDYRPCGLNRGVTTCRRVLPELIVGGGTGHCRRLVDSETGWVPTFALSWEARSQIAQGSTASDGGRTRSDPQLDVDREPKGLTGPPLLILGNFIAPVTTCSSGPPGPLPRRYRQVQGAPKRVNSSPGRRSPAGGGGIAGDLEHHQKCGMSVGKIIFGDLRLPAHPI